MAIDNSFYLGTTGKLPSTINSFYLGDQGKPGPSLPAFDSASPTPIQVEGSSATPTSFLEVQKDIGDQIRSVAAKLRYVGPVLGHTKVGARIGFLREYNGYIYILGIIGLGEFEEILQIEVGGRSYTTGDLTGSPNYKGDWSLAATWSDLGGLPYSAQVGDIFLYIGVFYTCRTAFSVTSYVYPYIPSPGGIYSAYFDIPLTGVAVNTYTGTATQTADALMAEVIVAGWTDTLRDTTADGESYAWAYFVAKIPLASNIIDFLECAAIVKGNKFYDPRTTLTAYTQNPALHLAGLITSNLWGMNASVDWDSVQDAADYCDEIFADGARIQLNIAIMPTKPEETRVWLEVLRAYALCYVYYSSGTYYLVSDKPKTSSGTLSTSPVSGEYPVLDLPKIQVKPVPTNAVNVRWTNQLSWVSARVDAVTAAVTAGTAIAHQSEFRMPGLITEGQAQRYADYRLEDSRKSNITLSWTMPDCGALMIIGNRYLLKAQNLGSGKYVIVTAKSESGVGTFAITAKLYDATIYETAP